MYTLRIAFGMFLLGFLTSAPAIYVELTQYRTTDLERSTYRNNFRTDEGERSLRHDGPESQEPAFRA